MVVHLHFYVLNFPRTLQGNLWRELSERNKSTFCLYLFACLVTMLDVFLYVCWNVILPVSSLLKFRILFRLFLRQLWSYRYEEKLIVDPKEILWTKLFALNLAFIKYLQNKGVGWINSTLLPYVLTLLEYM